jgi:hypothetical protein
MAATPTTLAELFRSLGLRLTIRAADDEPDAWACTLTRPDGTTYEIESVTFFDVDPDTDEEWIVEPGPTRVLGVLAGGEAETDDDEGRIASRETEAAARAFLGDDAFELLVRLDQAELDED